MNIVHKYAMFCAMKLCTHSVVLLEFQALVAFLVQSSYQEAIRTQNVSIDYYKIMFIQSIFFVTVIAEFRVKIWDTGNLKYFYPEFCYLF